MREEWEDDLLKAAASEGNRAAAARAVGIHTDTVRYHQWRDPQGFGARFDAALRSAPRRRAGALLAALLLSLPLAANATITSSPVDLGAEGLSVTVTLLRWQESAPDDWTSASAAGVTTSDLGGGLYTVSGLPAATGTDRYAVQLSAGGVGLQTYTYGAQPGTRIVWQQELDLPSAPTIFKQGDTFAALSLVVKRRLPAAACEPETTATVTAANAQTGAALFTDQAATITDCVLDATTGTYGATLGYDMQAGDLDTVGKYAAEFKLCYSPSSCQTVPTDGRLQFSVVKRLGG